MTGRAYPPEPWDLSGRGWITLWRVATDAVPPLPHGTRPLRIGRTALAVSVFVDYAPSGLLAYHELLAGVAVRHGRTPGLCITDIWVDSPESRAGGRALWGIPKELASFDDPTAARLPGGPPLAAAAFGPGGRAVRLPLPLRTRTIQATTDGTAWPSRIVARGTLARTTAAWRIPAAGPLAWLADGRPVLHLTAPDFAMTFGPSLL
ncbi:acetoacetate decarboxylase [Mumia flava]|uniref:Acetoacetate decarboxylase n=1 Tax=Mumia flava TaxID=1348852 RepID=A0A0B2BPY9_9ACTN|nr:acetoacetate decarboxylase family protein [Mumia flava]PJJ56587.1 acetoacetate decarboxylase [Mumia flava]